ncbi:MAG: hypothetical protein AAB885_03370 [Patescibacteria group bacterium]
MNNLKSTIVKIKNWCVSNQEKIRINAIIILIATLSFAIGYLIAQEEAPAQIIIEKNSQ